MADGEPPPDQVVFVGPARKEIRALDVAVRRTFGYALDMAAHGEKHRDAKAMQGSGSASVLELAVRHRTDTYRLVYWVGCSGYVFVLHAYMKKSPRGREIPGPDREMIAGRLSDARQLCQQLSGHQ